MNIASWLQRAGLVCPQLPAVAVGDAIVCDYQRLAQRCSGIAHALQRSLKLQPGDRVAIVAENEPGYLEVLFATWWSGLVVVPVNSKLHPSEIEWILNHSQVSAAFISKDLESALGAVQVITLRDLIVLGSERYEKAVRSGSAELKSREPDDIAWLFYTSGTTGQPKGAMLSHRNLASMSLAHISDLHRAMPRDALIHAAPLSHGSGLLSLPHVCRMGLNVLPESGGFASSELMDLINYHGRATMFASPTMVRRMVDASIEIDPGAIDQIIFGGAPMLAPDMSEAIERFGPCLAQLYGQGETPMTITAMPKHMLAGFADEADFSRLASAGIKRSAVEVLVADSEGGALSVGAEGEVLVRGDTVMLGYWDDPDASRRAIQRTWLHTGDIGSFDECGYLTLRDRLKDLIISGGSNIYPREVEEVLVAHPDVREVSVIGRPDPEWGEVVVAYVRGDVPADELDQLCLARIGRFKRPKEYVFVDHIPKNNYGKILKSAVREIDQDRQRSSMERDTI